MSIPMRIGHALHGLRETLGMTIVPREELGQRRALGLLLVVALVFGGAFGLARSARSGSAAASADDQSASGTALRVAHLDSKPALPALLVPKPRAPAPRPAAPRKVTTTTSTTTVGGLTTGPSIPVTSPAPSTPPPTPTPAPAPSPAPATPSRPSGGAFDDSG
jgi:hypothetical protein